MIPVLTALLAGCGGGDSDTDVIPVDVRLSEGDFPDPGADGLVFWGPDTVIPPYTDEAMCVFGTYTGPDIGVHATASFQADAGHHVVLLGISSGADQYPDGTIADCTNTNAIPMTDMEPVILASPDVTGKIAITLPDGVAAKLRSGQRYVVQSHYVNTTADALRIRDAITMTTLPVDQVQTWAAPMVLTATGFSIPAGGLYSVAFDCSFDASYDVMFVNGHMHEWGTSFSLDRADGDALTNIYSVPAWTVQYRDVPPTTGYAPGEMTFPAGTVYRTTCNWNNTTDHALEFPDEMCVAAGMVTPALTPVICSPE